MNYSNSTDDANASAALSIAIGSTYIVLSIPFLVCYILVSAAVWPGNAVDGLAVLLLGIAAGAFEIIGAATSIVANKLLFGIVAACAASSEGLVSCLALTRVFTIMEWLPQEFFNGYRSNLLVCLQLIYGIGSYIVCFICGNEVLYNRQFHVTAETQLMNFYGEAANLLSVIISLVSHITYYVKLSKKRKIMSVSARKILNMKQGFQLPLVLSAVYLVGEIYYFFIQLLVPAYALPGVIAQIVLIIFYGCNGVLMLLLNRRIRRLAIVITNKRVNRVGNID